jgi:hypothetical protein
MVTHSRGTCRLLLSETCATLQGICQRSTASAGWIRPARGRRPPAGGWLALLGFCPLQRFRNRRSAERGLTTPATFRPQRFPRSRRLPPPDPSRAYFIPVTLMGFWPSGLCSPRVAGPLSRPLLSCRSMRVIRRLLASRLQRFAPTADPYRETNGLGPSRGRCPPGLLPFRAFPPSAIESASRPFLPALAARAQGPCGYASECR